jgi:hypothetical protein
MAETLFMSKERNTRMLQPSPTTDQPKKSRQLRFLLNGILVVAILAGALLFSFTSRSEAHAASVVASTTSCATRQSSENFTDGFGNVFFWIRMNTHWCWNGVIVTGSSTSLYWGVTTLGNILGWHSEYNPQYTFNCYVAAGSTRNCSGNHEWMQEDFVGTPPEDCYLHINQAEAYKGEFAWNAAQRCIPF